MSQEHINGIGSVQGGDYEEIHIDGMGKLRGAVRAKSVHVNGTLKSKGRLHADEIDIDGFVRAFRDIKAKRMTVNGLLKARRANLLCDTLRCNGVIVCNREINADDARIEGTLSAARLYGDRIEILWPENGHHKRIATLGFMGALYYGRRVSMKQSLVDTLECTQLSAQRLQAKVVRAGSVRLSDHCYIKKLYCEGEIIADDTCRIGEIVKGSLVAQKTDIS